MKNKFDNFLSSLKETLWAFPRTKPVELLLIVAAYIAAESGPYDGLLLYPILLFAAISLNSLSGMKRLFYYIFAASAPLMFIDGCADFLGIKFLPLYILSMVGLILSRCKFEDKDCALSFLNFTRSLFNAMLFSTVAFCLVNIILASADYIFAMDISSDFHATIAYVVYIVAAPVLFVSAYEKKNSDELLGKIGETIFSKLSVPALLIYTLILYIYLGQIAIQWELPKGGIVYMTLSFMISSMVLGLLKKLSSTTLYEWFFPRLALVQMPILVMFWVAACYRIGEYGFTEDRVMLVVVGVAVTLSIFALLLCGENKRYFTVLLIWLALMTTGLLLPSKYISVASQKSRMESMARSLGFVDESGNVDLSHSSLPHFTAEQYDTFKELKNVIAFLNGNGESCNLTFDMPESFIEDVSKNFSVYPDYEGLKIPEEFSYIYFPNKTSVYGDDTYSVSTKNGKISFTSDDVHKQLMERIGVADNKNIVKLLQSDKHLSQLAYFEHEEFFLVIRRIEYTALGNDVKVKSMHFQCLFLKEKR